MLYSALITNLRNQTGDRRRRVHVDWTGDGSTTVFQLPDDTFPVLDQAGTYILKVAGSTKTETTDFTLDKEAGTIVFVNAAPTNGQAITFDASAVYVTDAGWLEIINSTIRSLGDDFWKEFIDTSLSATASMILQSLVAAQPLCIAVYDFMYRASSTENYRPVVEIANWRYDRDNNIIYIGDRNAFSTQSLKIRGLKTYTLGTAVSDTVDVQDKFLTIIEYGSLARYWRWRYKNVVELVSKLSTEASRTPLQELMMLSDRFERQYEIEKAKLKPQKPARIIPPVKEGSPRP